MGANVPIYIVVEPRRYEIVEWEGVTPEDAMDEYAITFPDVSVRGAFYTEEEASDLLNELDPEAYYGN